jgi:hypothetical protein
MQADHERANEQITALKAENTFSVAWASVWLRPDFTSAQKQVLYCCIHSSHLRALPTGALTRIIIARHHSLASSAWLAQWC